VRLSANRPDVRILRMDLRNVRRPRWSADRRLSQAVGPEALASCVASCTRSLQSNAFLKPAEQRHDLFLVLRFHLKAAFFASSAINANRVNVAEFG
jgi:hypothetical protein